MAPTLSPQYVITLTTDFGNNDHLVAAVKGVLLKVNPDVHIVDITHNVAPFDILDAAFTLSNCYKYFPSRTIHLVIVDPGVGTQRRPLLVSGTTHYFVAPDNGVLSPVYEQEERLTVRHITAEHYFLTPISNTFHGRDIFAPAAAWLSKNSAPSSFGDEVTDFVRFAMPKAKVTGNLVKGVVMKVDYFGNLITNVTAEDVPQLLSSAAQPKITVGTKEITKFVHTYAQGAAGEPIALIGSGGYLEICIAKGNAARTLGATRGSEVSVLLG